jgi:hypothetical protein
MEALGKTLLKKGKNFIVFVAESSAAWTMSLALR